MYPMDLSFFFINQLDIKYGHLKDTNENLCKSKSKILMSILKIKEFITIIYPVHVFMYDHSVFFIRTKYFIHISFSI